MVVVGAQTWSLASTQTGHQAGMVETRLWLTAERWLSVSKSGRYCLANNRLLDDCGDGGGDDDVDPSGRGNQVPPCSALVVVGMAVRWSRELV